MLRSIYVPAGRPELNCCCTQAPNREPTVKSEPKQHRVREGSFTGL